MRRGCGVISVARLARTFGESKQTVSAVSDAVETAARPELIHVRYFVACLGDPQSRAAADMLGCEQLGKRHELAAIGEAGQPPAWPRPPKLRRGVTRDRLLGSCVLYGELPTTRAPIRASGRRGLRKSKRWQRGPLIDSLGALELAGIERPSAQQRHALRAVVLSAAVLILVHRHVQHPVQAVLDAPMATHDVGGPHRGKVGTEEIVCGLVADRTVGLPLTRDLTYGGQARPLNGAPAASRWWCRRRRRGFRSGRDRQPPRGWWSTPTCAPDHRYTV
jgi:hypothetical protein